MNDINSGELQSVPQLPEYTLTPAMYGTGDSRKLISLTDAQDNQSHEQVMNAHAVTIDFSLGENTVAIGRDNATKAGLSKSAPEDAYLIDISDLGEDDSVSRFHGYMHHHRGNYRNIQEKAEDGKANVLLYTDRSSHGTFIMEPDVDEEHKTVKYNTKFIAAQRQAAHYTFEIKNGTILEFPQTSENKGKGAPRILCLRDPHNPTQWKFVRVGKAEDIDQSLYSKFMNMEEVTVSESDDPLNPHERREYNYNVGMSGHWDDDGHYNLHAIDFGRRDKILKELNEKIENKK